MSLATLPDEERNCILDFVMAIGDDEYLHGDRLSSWLTIAPTLEEDNVLTSIAQDEMGHARLWFELVSDYRDLTVDELAIERTEDDRRNSTLVERDYDDFADTVIRSLLYDRYEKLLLEAIANGTHEELTGRAEVALNEEHFHREHVDEWLTVFMSLSRERDCDRVRQAVKSNLHHADDLFTFSDAEVLVNCGALARSPVELANEWRESVVEIMLDLPIDLGRDELIDFLDSDDMNGRTGEHTDDLTALLREMQPNEIERLEM